MRHAFTTALGPEETCWLGVSHAHQENSEVPESLFIRKKPTTPPRKQHAKNELMGVSSPLWHGACLFNIQGDSSNVHVESESPFVVLHRSCPVAVRAELSCRDHMQNPTCI